MVLWFCIDIKDTEHVNILAQTVTNILTKFKLFLKSMVKMSYRSIFTNIKLDPLKSHTLHFSDAETGEYYRRISPF